MTAVSCLGQLLTSYHVIYHLFRATFDEFVIIRYFYSHNGTVASADGTTTNRGGGFRFVTGVLEFSRKWVRNRTTHLCCANRDRLLCCVWLGVLGWCFEPKSGF